ncbi:MULTISPECIES: STAS domain-containing protein [unclassified Streptomyces]|uniref:STAS domain-containing protein n=1 Tax=unclassified Streptomyces TaxID=2593676 RepID=UPI0033223E51
MHGFPDGPKVLVTRLDETLLITVSGDTDADDTDDFAAVWEAAHETGPTLTAVDLSAVGFADSMLLNALLEARSRHRAAGRPMVLLGPLPPGVHRLLSLSGVLEHFTIVENGPTQAG